MEEVVVEDESCDAEKGEVEEKCKQEGKKRAADSSELFPEKEVGERGEGEHKQREEDDKGEEYCSDEPEEEDCEEEGCAEGEFFSGERYWFCVGMAAVLGVQVFCRIFFHRDVLVREIYKRL